MAWSRVLVAVVVLGVSLPAHAATKGKVCLQACGARIAECTGACSPYGSFDKACRREVLKACKRAGVATCAAGTTTTTPSGGTTSTTMPQSLCDQFCGLVAANCTGANQQYATTQDCQTACAQFATNGHDGDTSGNTVQCRIYHATAAGASPMIHCPHTAPVSATCQ